MGGPLYDLLPPGDEFNSDDLLGRFLEYVAGKGLTLYPAQRREWVREVACGLGAALRRELTADGPSPRRADRWLVSCRATLIRHALVQRERELETAALWEGRCGESLRPATGSAKGVPAKSGDYSSLKTMAGQKKRPGPAGLSARPAILRTIICD
jgi:hypothetical protein